MKIIINGQEKVLSETCSVQELLLKLKINIDLIVVERNKKILDKIVYDKTYLKNGDKLEIIRFLGGG
ncbi:MAG: sulfur carrier protein ThiS [Candidatus Margulisbacteria bacterium]|nr:sulfur carrier protein ThiS [Candidatus Margulisiibacteriota bacterium]